MKMKSEWQNDVAVAEADWITAADKILVNEAARILHNTRNWLPVSQIVDGRFLRRNLILVGSLIKTANHQISYYCYENRRQICGSLAVVEK